MYTIDKANTYIKENVQNRDETYRPKFHLSGELGWINDPNGFSYYNGRYHLFYQHYPYKAEWGPMHWGHATTTNFVDWEYESIALAPDKPYDQGGCFSGSAITKDDTLYLMYTGHQHPNPRNPDSIRQVQCLAKSNDGIHFTKVKNNPVINTNKLPTDANIHDFRDPKVFKRNDVYYSIVGSLHEDEHGQILLYKSSDMIDWTFVSTMLKSDGLGKMWECPDLIQLGKQDVLLLSTQFIDSEPHRFSNVHGSLYMIGNFDDSTGKFDYNVMDEIDKGFDFYAPQTTQAPDGRTIMVAWMQMWDNPMPTQDHHWAGVMTMPRELILKDNNLYQWPAREIEATRINQVSYETIEVNQKTELESIEGTTIDLIIEVDVEKAKKFSIELFKCDQYATTLTYDVEEKMVIFTRDNSGIGPKGTKTFPIDIQNNRLHIRILLDVSSIEIFLEKGKHALSNTVFPSAKGNRIAFDSVGTSVIKYLKKYDIDYETKRGKL